MSVQDEAEYEEILSLWSDLEAGLGVILTSPFSVEEFEQRIWQYDRWMKNLLERDADLGLYLLFQLATHSSAGYSTSHALVCAVLCHLIAQELKLSQKERDALVHAALVMNISMTALQDALALQSEKLTQDQIDVVRSHAAKGGLMLSNLAVSDALLIEVVSSHHDEHTDKVALSLLAPHQRLTRILRAVDRYAAMISPRKSREGRNANESARSIMSGDAVYDDEVGRALVGAVGLCPPGTYVQLDDASLAVVMRRSSQLNLPHVAIVSDTRGELLAQPRLHRTTLGAPKIQVALAASVVRLHLNHHLILQLSIYAAEHK